MYNPLLTTFLTIADCGSFNKAARQLFISPTAVMKQMNDLEKHLGIILIDRSAAGIKLTCAGQIIYRESKFLIDYSDRVITNAKTAAGRSSHTFCVGTSLLNPAKPFMDLWYKLNREFCTYKLHLVPFADEHNGILAEIQQLGQKFDFLVGVCNSRSWLDICNFLPLGRYRKMVAVALEHPLAQKNSLKISDLYDQTLMMVPKGDSPVNDFIRQELALYHPRIKLEDTPIFYDLSVFNRCAETNNILLTIECWQNVHPGLIYLPVDWPYTIPYGLMYSRRPDRDVLHFIQETKNILQTEKS